MAEHATFADLLYDDDGRVVPTGGERRSLAWIAEKRGVSWRTLYRWSQEAVTERRRRAILGVFRDVPEHQLFVGDGTSEEGPRSVALSEAYEEPEPVATGPPQRRP